MLRSYSLSRGALRTSSARVLVRLLLLATFTDACLVKCTQAAAISLDSLAFSLNQYLPGSQYPLINQLNPQTIPDKSLSLSLDLSFLSSGFLTNQVQTLTDKGVDGSTGQFRTVGWQYQLGAHVFDTLDVFYEHHSQHVLDETNPNHFPLEDSVGFTYKIFLSSQPKKAMF